MAAYRFREKMYHSFLNDLKKYKKDYVVISSGLTEKFIYKDNTYTLIDAKSFSGAGYHLCAMLKKDILEWITVNSDKLIKREHDYKEQYFNINAIEKIIGQPCLAYDINDCYWDTVYKLGFIKQRTYVLGKKRSDWKQGRVAAIGSLAKTETRVPYINGEKQAKLRETIKTPIEYQYIRNNVIGSVYDMFYRLYQEIGDKQFYMFLTDCVYFDVSQVNYIKKFFAARGYRIKSKSIEFIEVNRKKKYVAWIDWSEKDESKRKKYYQYNDIQLKF